MTDTELSMTTPGPWRLNPHDDLSVLGPDNFRIADCSNLSFDRAAPSYERQKANARLITAAPELYEENVRLKYALMSILRLDSSNDLPDAWDIANDALTSPDAIARATGGMK